jgi:uncharacterized membrane protein
VSKGRLEAFGDAVIAIIITIMVLGFRVPEGTRFSSLMPLAPKFLSYVLTFIFLAIYWNNHHHLFHAVEQVNGSVLWANFHLLFWLSLTPFATAWLGEGGASTDPVALYGLVLIFAALAYTILVRVLIALHGKESPLGLAIGGDFKGIASLALYALGLILAFILPSAAPAVYVVVALLWLVPDRRFEKRKPGRAE